MRIHEEYEGIFTISAFKVDAKGDEIPGTRRAPVPPFRNLITNGGLDRMGGNADYLTWCQVGSGSTAPSAGDSNLVSRVAGSSTLQSTLSGVQPSAPYFTWRRNTKRFATGVAAGNLAEVGMGWLSTGGLFSRALILDALGTPTTITILADESLDVTYELRAYPKVTDSTGTIVATGNIGGSYDFIMRAANVTSNDDLLGWHIAQNGTEQGRLSVSAITSRRVYNGPIGPITGLPSGSSLNVLVNQLAYSLGSLERKFVVALGLNDGNIASGINSTSVKIGIGVYQCQFTPPIPKTSEDEVNLTFVHTWARRP